MNTSYGDLKEIFSTPPTEARYSWIIRSGNHTLEGSELRRNVTHLEGRHHQFNNTTEDGGRVAESTLQEDSDLRRNHQSSPRRDFNTQQEPSKKRQAPQPHTRTNSLNLFDPQDDHKKGEDHGNQASPSGGNTLLDKHSVSQNVEDEERDQLLLDISEDQGIDAKQNIRINNSFSPKCHSPPRQGTRQALSPSQGTRQASSLSQRIRSTGLLVETKQQNISTNSAHDLTTSPLSNSYTSSSPRVFGGQYNRAKRAAIQRPFTTELNQNGSEGVTVDQVKNMRLQEELNSAHKKINRLNHINQNALKRKGELQQEVLEAYKKISDLEVGKHVWNEKQRELTSQLNAAKQRVGDAEREAAHAIGCQSKLQRDALEAESKKQKYFDDLNLAEKRISKLEDLMKDLEQEAKEESHSKSQLQQKLCENEASLKLVSNDNKNLQNKLSIKEKEMSVIERRFEREIILKQQFQSKSSELGEQNKALVNNFKRLESKNDLAERTIDQYSTKLSAEREKYEISTTLRTNAERELRDTKQVLNKERSQKELLNTECQVAIEKYRNLKRNHEKTTKQNEFLRRENRDLKDRVLCLELYQKISDKRSTSNRGESNGDKNKIKRSPSFLDTLGRSRSSRETATNLLNGDRNKSRSRNGSRDSWDQNEADAKSEAGHEDQVWEQSRRVQSAWGRNYGSNNSLDHLSEMSAEIEKLQKEQKVLNHVTTESCTGNSKPSSQLTTARKSLTPRGSRALNETRNNGASSLPTSPKKSTMNTPRLSISKLNDTLVSFRNDEDEDGEEHVENLATYSDLLSRGGEDANDDIALALM